TTSFSLVDGVVWPRPAHIRPDRAPCVGISQGWGRGDTKEASIVAANHFSVSNIEIPPRGSIVFEVSLLSTYLFNGSGKILVDFASGSFELISAYMSLSIGRPQFPRPPFAAVHESAFGTKRTSRHAQPMSAFGGKADIGRMRCDVRF